MAPNGVTAPGVDAEHLPHQVGRAEREAAGGAEPPVQRFQLDRGVLQRGHQEQRVLLVLEEQVLGVAAGNRAAQACDCSTVNSGGWRHGRVRDAEAVEGGEKLVGGGGHWLGHGPFSDVFRPWLQSPSGFWL